jgi:putative ABC transport system substrate-binding protein
MRRRDFIKVIAGSATVWPLAARAQQGGAVRHVGVLLALPESDPEWLRRVNALKRGLEELGWIDGRNVALEFRSSGNAKQLAALATEMAQTNVDAIVVHSAPAIEAARNATKTIPIVMALVGDAVGAGYVASLAHPGGNLTGQPLFATEQSGKRLELIREFSANLNRLGVLWNTNIPSHHFN